MATMSSLSGCQIDVPERSFYDTSCQLAGISIHNAQFPLIGLVCRESRGLVFENWELLYEFFDRTSGNTTKWIYPNIIRDSWLRRTTDFVHVNWNLDYYTDIFDEPKQNIENLETAARRACGASFDCSLIRGFNDTIKDFTYTSFFELLGERNEYRACIKTVILHLSPKTVSATDLFGLLGEERIQHVNASDTGLIEQYHPLCPNDPRGVIEGKENFELLLSPSFPALVD